jgi:prolyl 3-hydroxylase /prolyl 3,4-dihydroxylase
MAPHNEEDDPAVYRAGTYKKSDALANGKPKATVDGHTNGSTPVNGKHASNGGSPNGKNKSPSPSHSEDADGDVEIPDVEEEDEEDDSTLLTVQPGFNRLLLVLRDERVMRFVKYVSAAAEGSRWDVCAEYEVGMMQEDDDDDDSADA